jgi:hypothetical protein
MIITNSPRRDELALTQSEEAEMFAFPLDEEKVLRVLGDVLDLSRAEWLAFREHFNEAWKARDATMDELEAAWRTS